MLRCASSLVIAAYAKVRLIPQDLRALPAAFLRSRHIFSTFFTRSSFLDVSDLIPPGILNEKDHLRKRIYGIWRNPLDTQNPSSYIAAL